ncbi:hypothetical protein GCM10025787_35440 [Saccharopolyspora rosea]|uniref:DUF397 domain-containing protein n=1 Tax=Saccharopolyspora rosea TaxID=524884 RepID=A0ABW3FXY6_9PSEU
MNTHTSPPSPTGWFKSSFSNPAQDCVEANFAGDTVYVRDSKDKGGPILTIPATHWPSLLDEVAGRAPSGSNRAVRITHRADGGTDLKALMGPAVNLSYTATEWDAFVAGVLDAQFDLPSEEQLAAASA